jgi:hypothetical protein
VVFPTSSGNEIEHVGCPVSLLCVLVPYLLRRHPHELDPGPCPADVDDSESWVIVTSERRTEFDRSEGDAHG